ncbi:MAG: ABC transporter permease [Roseburia sp.]
MSESSEKDFKNQVIERIIFFLVPVVLLIIWQILGNAGIINATIMPTPSSIFKTFLDLLKSGDLAEDLGASMGRVLIGFFFGTLAGLLFGIVTGLYPKINKAVAAIFGILRPIPMIGLVPLMILWFGIGEKSKIIVIAVGTFWSVLINTQEGIFNVNDKLIEVAQLLEKNKITVLTKIIFPAAIPSIFTGIRLGVGNAWKSVVAAEMLAATKGVGHMIEYARELAQPEKLFVGLLSIGIIGLVIDAIIMTIQKKLFVWE